VPSEALEAVRRLFEQMMADLGSAPLPLAQRREQVQVLGRLFVPDEDTVWERSDLAGVPVEWVWTRGVPDGHVVLYLHGGGYTAGDAAGSRRFAGRLSSTASHPSTRFRQRCSTRWTRTAA
jgi:monoterpene epsilon-lactone hydrolase